MLPQLLARTHIIEQVTGHQEETDYLPGILERRHAYGNGVADNWATTGAKCHDLPREAGAQQAEFASIAAMTVEIGEAIWERWPRMGSFATVPRFTATPPEAKPRQRHDVVMVRRRGATFAHAVNS